jgi:hypothetical protein
MKLITKLLVGELLVAATVWAQVSGGTISGTVTDSSGGVVPGASISITNTQTNVIREAVTDDKGLYVVPNLLPGSYTVTATATGFTETTSASVELNVGAEKLLNLQMSVGSVKQEVRVSEAPPPNVETGNATVSGVVEAQQVRELPLNGRDWTSLAMLQPGVSQILTQPTSQVTNSTRLNRGLGAQLTIGGNRPQQNNYRVDGVSINDYANAAPGGVLGSNLGVDAVEEFQVITSNAPAPYGLSSGGIINAETRSGTNQFHGSVYDFLRNSALDARNYFDGPSVPPFHRNQFGASAGGPIVEGRTFIFGDYEGVRQSLTSSDLIFTPTEAARSGQLVSGKVKVDPLVVPYLALWPLPNGSISGDTGIYSFASKQIAIENFFTIRVDHTFSQNDFMHGTYLFDDGNTKGPDNMDALIIGTSVRRQMVSLEETHTFSAQLLNTARFGFARTYADAPRTLGVINALANDTVLGFTPGAPPGQIAVTGIESFQGGPGGLGEFRYHYNTFQFYDDVFRTQGKHSLQFGGAVIRIQNNELGSSHVLGQFKFGSLSSFLQNKPSSIDSALSPVPNKEGIRQTVIAGYFQDNWKAFPRLTLNLGLRYEMSTVPTEVQNKLSTLPTPTSVNPRLGSPYFQNPTLRNFEPRIGLAWDPFGDGKTAIRSAFGIYDVLPLPYLFELPTLLSAPYFEEGTATKLPTGSFPHKALTMLRGLRQAYIQPNPGRNYVMQWNLVVQRELVRPVTVSIGYIGSEGVHQPFNAPDMNIVLPTLTPAGYEWPTPRGSGTIINPTNGAVAGLLWEGTSSYHGLQLKVNGTVGNSFQYQGSYTWSKNIDTSSSSVAGSTFDNSVVNLPWFDLGLNRSLSDYDIRHVATLNYLWKLPQPRSSGAAAFPLRGWTWGSILNVRSGLPFSPQIGGDALGLNSSLTFDYPDLLPGCAATNPGSVNYLNTPCFRFPSPATLLGNAGRNSLIGPGLVGLDTGLIKDSHIGERFDLQFQAEFFNALNHTNFAPPLKGTTAVFNQSGALLPNAGQITSTVTTSRQIQFALKFIW